LFFSSNIYGQVDPKKIDSLSRLIDSSAHAYKVQQDSVIKYHNSAYKSGVDKALQQNAQNFLTEQKRKEKERRRISISIALGILLFLIAIVALMRRRKPKP
jgi:hypothetical protein